ncbi:MAG: pyrroline-5-carboxylate reductase [Desulfovibrio sp.]|nr:pyrroline-5-carboxylate reductase [Desulfovibrio sp.]
MARTIGCIGCGNMGGALISGFAGVMKGGEYAFCGCNRSPERMRPLAEKGVSALADAKSVAEQADIIVLAVKPAQVAEVLGGIRHALNADKILVSVAAGIGLKRLDEGVDGRCPVVRCMPDTPALVGKGVFAFCFAEGTEGEARKEILELFGRLGQCFELPEAKFAAFSALVGAGPAYVFEMMQGLVQAGVTLGFTHADARRMVAGLFEGCAEMARRDGAHLMQMRDAVCSPGGLTIAGVNVLDRRGLCGMLVDAVLAADARGREMEK